MKNKNLTPLKSIRAHCLGCSNHQPKEVKQCQIEDCPLWDYRLGRNPRRQGIGRKKLVNAEILS